MHMANKHQEAYPFLSACLQSPQGQCFGRRAAQNSELLAQMRALKIAVGTYRPAVADVR